MDPSAPGNPLTGESAGGELGRAFVIAVFVWRAQGELVITLRTSLSLQSVNGLDSQKSAAHNMAGSNTR